MRIDVRTDTADDGTTLIALEIDGETTYLTKAQAKHLARLLHKRADGKAVYSQQRISETTLRYAEQILHDFLPQTPELELGGRILTTELISIYHRWQEQRARAHGYRVNHRTSNVVLGRAMKAAGFHLLRSSGKRYYIGLSRRGPVAPSDGD